MLQENFYFGASEEIIRRAKGFVLIRIIKFFVINQEAFIRAGTGRNPRVRTGKRFLCKITPTSERLGFRGHKCAVDFRKILLSGDLSFCFFFFAWQGKKKKKSNQQSDLDKTAPLLS